MIITIDGPVASGKSTVARLLAKDLGYYYVASGMWYRALAYLLLHEAGCSFEQLYTPDMQIVGGFFKDIDYTYDDEHKERLWYNQQEITPHLKTKEIDQASSILSLNPPVRESLLCQLRSLAQKKNIIIDGRDCGSVIFPHAEVKIYLTADLQIRAHRWLLDQQKKGFSLNLDQARSEVEIRDKRDSERKIAPLCVPEGAHIIDSSSLNNASVMQLIKKCIS